MWEDVVVPYLEMRHNLHEMTEEYNEHSLTIGPPIVSIR
jgi:hypothetical protein